MATTNTAAAAATEETTEEQPVQAAKYSGTTILPLAVQIFSGAFGVSDVPNRIAWAVGAAKAILDVIENDQDISNDHLFEWEVTSPAE